MTKTIDTLKRALEDETMSNVDLITPDVVSKVLNTYPDSKYFSEWRYEMAGKLRYSYRHHDADLGRKLSALHSKGITSNLPRLTAVYSRKELSNLVASSS